MDIDGASAVVTLTLGLIALAGAIAGWVKWARPRWQERERDRIAQRDALIGRPAMVDSITGEERYPALLGIGQRMAAVEVAIAELAKSNLRHEAHEAHLAALEKLAAAHEAHMTRHDREIGELQRAQVERIVTKAESVAAWGAVEAVAKNNDYTDEQPDL